jgi:hypothetical protein
MGAPIGNQFWKLRSKHGRDKLFETPDLLWEAACEYFQWCENTPFYKCEAKTVNIGDYQSQIEIAKIPTIRPFTLHGLCIYLGCHSKYFNDFEAANHKDFSNVITRIKEIIYEQKFTGAASGFFNANIIARDLGLADKREVEKVKKKLTFKDAE